MTMRATVGAWQGVASLRHARLCELNVIEQVVNVCQATVVQDAWARGQHLKVHALIYGLHDGVVRRLGLHVGSPDDLAQQDPAVGVRVRAHAAPRRLDSPVGDPYVFAPYPT